MTLIHKKLKNKMKIQTITGLWVGSTLPLMAQLCIKSFLDHGHSFQLFTYTHYDNVPKGTLVRDAREILPEEAVFHHENGSLAPFADWFRNVFLVQEGGFWTDLDVACLSDEFPDTMPWFCMQEPGLVAVGVIAFPPRHPMMEALQRLAEDPASPAPWDSPEEIHAREVFGKSVPDVAERRRKAPWGHCGPEGFTRALKHFGLLEQAAKPSRLYPLHYTVWRKCYNGDCNLRSPELSNAWAIHLWGEMLRREPDAWENVSRNSVVGELLDRHLPEHPAGPVPATRKKVKVLVGICSCNNAANRRKACRETWLSHPAPGIECKFFLGRREPIDGEDDVVTLWVNDDYAHLPSKGLAFYKYALEHYDFDWLFKCDDDTYLVLDRLESLCDDRYDLIGDMCVESRKSPSGGAGYLMSRHLVELFVSHASQVPDTGCEDLIFGALAVELGVPMLASRRLIMSSSPPPHKENDLVTAHWCSPVRLHDIEMLFHGTPIGVFKGCHPDWEDDVLFFRNGRFLRRASGCMGRYFLNGESCVILKWDDWPEETLFRDGGVFRQGGFSLSPSPGQPSLLALLTSTHA